MDTLRGDQWRVVSAYLDQALDLPEDMRTAWLASLDEQDPIAASRLRQLLARHRAVQRERFLEDSSEWPVLTPALAGQRVGAYTIVAPIGRGGMGSVWRAKRSDGRFDRQAAIKFLNIALMGPPGEARFTREGRILAKLVHPQIAQLVDAGVSAEGQPYLVLEHVDGEHIDQYCERRGLDVNARIRLVLEVLAAVAHAHANLVVHRDIKPSNVLVTPDGQVKLLDFGVAKLLEETGDGEPLTNLTRDGAAALTPLYAAPEQITGAAITTATDVYALGLLLYVLLARRHPFADSVRSPADAVKVTVEHEPPRMVDGGRAVAADLQTIVAKALKKNPAERYGSVAALADDLRRFLRHEPIHARPDTMAYRMRKFLRRNRVAAVAAAVVLAGVSVGLYEVNRERAIAERRFLEVRQLAMRLFDIDAQVRQLAGSTKTRQMIVDTSLDYLRRVGAEAHDDPGLALELGTAYMRVARVQGVPISVNLGQVDAAERNLQTAESMVRSVLAARPDTRIAYLRRGQIAHDRMILAGDRRPDAAALPLARESAMWLERYLDTGPVDPAESGQVLLAMNNVANRFRINGLFEEALRVSDRAIKLAPTLNEPRQLGSLLQMTAFIHRDRGDLEHALRDIREAVRLLDTPDPAAPADQGRLLNFALALSREGAILGDPDRISLGRPRDAIAPLEQAFALTDGFAHKDAADRLSRGQMQPGVMVLARIVRDSDPRRALDLYDHFLRHAAEIKNNPQFRRYEARALAASCYPLMELGRLDDSRQRLDAAFERLKDLKLYPSSQIALGSEADDALRARGDVEARAGHVPAAIETYDTLLTQVMASKPDAEKALADAVSLSRLYHSLADLNRRAARSDVAAAFDSRRLALWQHWDRALPGSSFIARQLQATH